MSGALWTATEALPGRERPDASEAPSVRFDPGSTLVEIERLGLWVRVENAEGKLFWVDGRRLVAGATAPQSPPPVPSVSAADTQLAPVRAGRIPVVAAVALWLSALIPWWGEDGLEAADTSLFHVWDGSYDRPVWTIGRVVFLLGIAALVSVFWKPAMRHRTTIAWVTIAVAIAWLVATYIYLMVSQSEPWITAFSEMATTYFAPGPWVALAAGTVLAVTHRE